MPSCSQPGRCGTVVYTFVVGKKGVLVSSGAIGGKVVLGGGEFVVGLGVVDVFLGKVVKKVVILGGAVDDAVLLSHLKSSVAFRLPL